MNHESKESEKHENVKERLNNLLVKKMNDHNEKVIDNQNKILEIAKEKHSNASQSMITNELALETNDSLHEAVVNDEDLLLNQHVLVHVLNEKKKELLRNQEVIQFLQSKLK